MAIVDSEQQGRFDSVHVQLPSNELGLLTNELLHIKRDTAESY